MRAKQRGEMIASSLPSVEDPAVACPRLLQGQTLARTAPRHTMLLQWLATDTSMARLWNPTSADGMARPPDAARHLDVNSTWRSCRPCVDLFERVLHWGVAPYHEVVQGDVDANAGFVVADSEEEEQYEDVEGQAPPPLVSLANQSAVTITMRSPLFTWEHSAPAAGSAATAASAAAGSAAAATTPGPQHFVCYHCRDWFLLNRPHMECTECLRLHFAYQFNGQPIVPRLRLCIDCDKTEEAATVVACVETTEVYSTLLNVDHTFEAMTRLTLGAGGILPGTAHNRTKLHPLKMIVPLNWDRSRQSRRVTSLGKAPAVVKEEMVESTVQMELFIKQQEDMAEQARRKRSRLNRSDSVRPT